MIVVSTSSASYDSPTCLHRPNIHRWRLATRHLVSVVLCRDPSSDCLPSATSHIRLSLPSWLTTTQPMWKDWPLGQRGSMSGSFIGLPAFSDFTYQTFTPELVDHYSADVERLDVTDRVETMNETFAKVIAFLQNSGSLLARIRPD